MPAITLTHVGLCVSDLAVAERFYVEALGFARVRDLSPPDAVVSTLLRVPEPVGLTAVYLRSGDVVLELIHFDREGNDAARERSFTEPGLTHLSFAVDDLAATCDAITAQGGQVLRDTDVTAAVLVEDPDGQVLELVATR